MDVIGKRTPTVAVSWTRLTPGSILADIHRLLQGIRPPGYASACPPRGYPRGVSIRRAPPSATVHSNTVPTDNKANEPVFGLHRSRRLEPTLTYPTRRTSKRTQQSTPADCSTSKRPLGFRIVFGRRPALSMDRTIQNVTVEGQGRRLPILRFWTLARTFVGKWKLHPAAQNPFDSKRFHNDRWTMAAGKIF